MNTERSVVFEESAKDVHQSALIDAQYALWQLRQFQDIARAVDALERIESRAISYLQEQPSPVDATTIVCCNTTVELLRLIRK